MSDIGLDNTDDVPEQKCLFDVTEEEEDEEEERGSVNNACNKVLDVTLTNKHPKLQGFGLDISGGIDRPYMEEDNGIFVSAVKSKGLAEKSGELEVGDKILQVNGTSVLAVKHEEAVKLFLADRSQVTLRIQKNYGLLLRAASLTPSPTPSAGQVTPSSDKSISPRKEKNREYHTNLSISGFVVGVAIGCVCVVLLRRYITTPKT